MKKLIFFLFAILSFSSWSQSPEKLWYNQPASHFEESLVLGNGTAGASVFGGVESDKIFLNDITLWSGGPVDPYMNPEAYKSIPAIREALVLLGLIYGLIGALAGYLVLLVFMIRASRTCIPLRWNAAAGAGTAVAAGASAAEPRVPGWAGAARVVRTGAARAGSGASASSS